MFSASGPVRVAWRAAQAALPLSPEARRTMGLLVEHWARVQPSRPCVFDEKNYLSWDALNQRANRLAHVLRAEGIEVSDTVAINMANRTDYVVTIVACAKIGASCALINTSQQGEILSSSLRLVAPKLVVLGAEQVALMEPVLADLPKGKIFWLADPMADEQASSTAKDKPDWARDLESELETCPASNLAVTKTLTKSLPFYKVFTSGTTGLPKAAILSHKRWLVGATGFGQLGLRFSPDDRMFVTLPLYHNNAATVAFGAVVTGGGSMVLRRKFSASRFWDDIIRTDCNSFTYIGELCRYLLLQPPRPTDRQHRIEKIVGNGLRPDLWMEFKERFGIERICEFYAASESNSGFLNVFNLDQTVGCAPSPYDLVAYDIDNDMIIRDKKGHARKVKKGEPGLLVTEISDRFPLDGYTDAKATEKKILRNLFKKGDAYFNTGDLLKEIDTPIWLPIPHLQFVDRVGDTFRWKGENVSTTEVESVVSQASGVSECSVYGVEVPKADGRAGMAAIVVDGGPENFRPKALAEHVLTNLPHYAAPIFVRILAEIETTGTFKHRKGDLKKDGFAPETCADGWVLDRVHKTYIPLSDEVYQRIVAGTYGL